MKLILDCGSGNTCRNDKAEVKAMIDAIHAVDTGKHEIILKWQLFLDAPPNLPLNREVFNYAYHYAESLGYQTTASVFDRDSLEVLQMYDVPFIKIACRPDLYHFVDDIDNCYMSVSGRKKYHKGVTLMACVSKYPAYVLDYQMKFPLSMIRSAISDHTEGWELYRTYKPAILEKHFVHKRESDNPDAGAFAVTAEELKEIM